MRVDWDVAVAMDDGLELRANVYLPDAEGRWPVILTYGPYGKDLSFAQGYGPRWKILEVDYPDALEGTSGDYQAWETPDPERWTAAGYAVVRVDSRGAGRSPGYVDCLGPRERLDLAGCIEWAGEQPWSTGKVGMTGISYYAVNAWQAAALDPAPEHLAAVCGWEGCNDWYREAAYHGGIPCDFLGIWFPRQVESVQHGSPNRGRKNPVSGLLVTGDVELPTAELLAGRADVAADNAAHEFLDEYWRERSADTTAIRIPFLSAGNWGGHALHLRGNLSAFERSPSPDKWLEIHGREHWAMFYADYGFTLQRRFFDWYLKGEGDWLETQPRVQLQIRYPDDTFVTRAEDEWPLARTNWTRWYLTADSGLAGSSDNPSFAATYSPGTSALKFTTTPFADEVEITGPISSRLWVQASSTDADLFLTLRAYGADGEEMLFRGAGDPYAPMAQGWLRLSHRTLDPQASRSWQPVHPHGAAEPVTPEAVYAVDVEIWPTCLVLPAGSWITLEIGGVDYDHGLSEETLSHGRLSWSPKPTRGSGPYTHAGRLNGPDGDVYRADVTVHGGGVRPSSLLIPIVPSKQGGDAT